MTFGTVEITGCSTNLSQCTLNLLKGNLAQKQQKWKEGCLFNAYMALKKSSVKNERMKVINLLSKQNEKEWGGEEKKMMLSSPSSFYFPPSPPPLFFEETEEEVHLGKFKLLKALKNGRLD